MKTLQVVFSILVFGLTGCAHTGYQQSYVGYSADYSRYEGQPYYDYSAPTYYQPTPVIYYEQQYLPSYHPHRHEEHGHWQRKHDYEDRDRDTHRSRHTHSQSDNREHHVRLDADVRRHELRQRENRQGRRQDTSEQRNQNDFVARASRHADYSVPRSHGGGSEGGQSHAVKSGHEHHKHERR